MRTSTSLLTLVALSSTAWAVDGVVPVQGQLYDGEGAAVDTSVVMAFSLETVTGEDVWSESQTVPVDYGSFTAYLGDIQPLDLALFRDNPQLFLVVSIDGDEMDPIEIGNAPVAGYAAFAGEAHDALTLEGATRDDLTYTAGAGLTLTNNAFAVDEGAVEATALAVCFDSEAELVAVLDDNYLPASWQPTATDLEGALNTGPGSGFDADTVDGMEAEAFAVSDHSHGGADITRGVLDPARFSAYADLASELLLDDDDDGDLLTRGQLDTRYVNANQGIPAAQVVSGVFNNDRFSAISDLYAEGFLGDNADTDLLFRSEMDARFLNDGDPLPALDLTGTVPYARYSAFGDLAAEGYFGNNADTDLLGRAEMDTRYLNADEDLPAGNLTGTIPYAQYSAYSDLANEGWLDNDYDGDLMTRLQADARFASQPVGTQTPFSFITMGGGSLTIIAHGSMAANGTLTSSGSLYTPLSSTWNSSGQRYEIAFTGHAYDSATHTTVVTPGYADTFCATSSANDKLLVYCHAVD